MIMICYDGSRDAEVAVKQAAILMPGHPAIILTVWEPSALEGGSDRTAAEAGAAAHAERTASEGALLAHQLGIDCHARTCRQQATVAMAILTEGRRADVGAIVLGRGGRQAPSLSGSVSRAVVRGAECAVLVAAPVSEPTEPRAAGRLCGTSKPVRWSASCAKTV
jgi:nucleotide-binding universal stress UspA family protein